MAVTLIEAAKSAPTPLQAGVINMYARSSEILRVLPFDNIESNAVTVLREHTLPGVGFRGINEAYAEDAGVLNPVTETLAIMGGDMDVDRYIVKTMGLAQRTARVAMKIKAAAHRFTRAFVKGDSAADPREFDGLQKRIAGNQLINAGSASGGDALSLGKLDEVIDAVDSPTHIIANKTIGRLLTAAARATSVSGFITWDKDEFGRRIAQYNGLPILTADDDNLGNQILPFTEANPGGGSPASTSIYVVSFGPAMLTGIQNGGIDVRDLGEVDDKPVLRTRVEWYASPAFWHGRSAARLRGIKSAAVVA